MIEDNIVYLTYYYWIGEKFDDLPYNHNSSVEFSKDVLFKSIEHILSMNYHILLKKSGNFLILCIDNKNFRQR